MAETNLSRAIELVDDLNDQEFSSLIDYIRQASKLRQGRRSAVAYATLQEGDRVSLSGNNKPAYLNRQIGTIVEKRQTRMVVELDCGPIGKFKSGRVICPASVLTKIG